MRRLLFPLFFVSSLSACQTAPYCEEAGRCGGELLPPSATESAWTLSGGCMDEVKSAAIPPSQVRQPAKPAGERPVERTLPDWCSSIVLSADGTVKDYDGFSTMLEQNEGWFPGTPIAAGSLTFSSDGRYKVSLTQRLAQRADLSASCLSAQGVSLTCATLATSLQAKIAEQLGNFVKDPSYLDFTANVSNVACGDGAAGGCICDYDLTIFGGPSGRYSRAGTTLTFFDDQYRPPSLTDYCVHGATLDVSSQEQTRLFNKADLRNTTWTRP